MAKTTIVIKDKNFRIVIPEAIRAAEKLEIGDIIEIDIRKIGKIEVKE
jgi:bifunctional DNA-binding transcriptional regulator/antitoxin component of YhaV-PrlF toxin-antitoxin module